MINVGDAVLLPALMFAVTAKVEDYYGFVIRRLAAQGQLPAGFHAEVPPSPRVATPVL